ncbi:hypothetical protein GCM10023196_102780 [Actinoallomurus vinaceus]|uniref:Uncharacterized protein n=2 Tax=Actinoallomurus vinaceus TaxID=1080074 RepID=A0ABP8UWJ2_9ACTN
MVMALALVGLGLATARPAHALGKGRACMFNATEGANGLGHVGWAFRVGPADDWIYGATESASWNWQRESNYATMLATFRTTNGRGYYDHFRCKDTTNSSVTAAKNKVNQVYSRPYNVVNDNCLTRSVEIFKAYDSSFNNLGNGIGNGPNWYYDNQLIGFGGRIYL